MHQLIATWFGIGYIRKGGGTVAALCCCVILYVLHLAGLPVTGVWGVVAALALLALGTWSGNKVEGLWGKDSYRVVIDEVAGMLITMLFVPFSLLTLGCGLVLFRVFDIWKPLFIRSMEKLPGGAGVMMDDVLAGIYACAVLHLAVRLNWVK